MYTALGKCRQSHASRQSLGSALPRTQSLNPINIYLQYVASIIDEMQHTTNYNDTNLKYIKQYYDSQGLPIDTAYQALKYELWQQKTALVNIKNKWRPYFQQYDVVTLGAAVTSAIIVSAVALLGVGVAWSLLKSTREATIQLKMRIDAAKAGLNIPDDKRPLFDIDFPEWFAPAAILTGGLIAASMFVKKRG